jgi:hypothetical protein
MDVDFTDIKIVSLEEELTAPSPNDPALRSVFLKLSATPPPGWVQSFNQSRKIARHVKWRKATVDRKFIVVECIPEEIESHHLRDLKQDVYYANGEYKKYLRQQYQGDYKAAQTQSLERDRIREMKDRLKFD